MKNESTNQMLANTFYFLYVAPSAVLEWYYLVLHVLLTIGIIYAAVHCIIKQCLYVISVGADDKRLIKLII